MSALALSLAAGDRASTITTFDIPGAGGPVGQGGSSFAINPKGISMMALSPLSTVKARSKPEPSASTPSGTDSTRGTFAARINIELGDHGTLGSSPIRSF